MTCAPYLYQCLLLGRLLVCACQLVPPALQLLLLAAQGLLLLQVPCLLLLFLLALQLLLVPPAMSGGGSAEPVLQPADAKHRKRTVAASFARAHAETAVLAAHKPSSGRAWHSLQVHQARRGVTKQCARPGHRPD